jgi:hypothetical protein
MAGKAMFCAAEASVVTVRGLLLVKPTTYTATAVADPYNLLALFFIIQTEDLARMFRLFSRVPRGLDPIADIFKQHVESEGMKLVKEVAEAVEAKKEKDAGEAGHF